MGSSDRDGVVTFPSPRHYDASSKNFLLMKGPGIAAQTRNELVADNDITPSLAELADEFQTEPANDPARRTDFEAKLDALRNCSGESCHAAEDAP